MRRSISIPDEFHQRVIKALPGMGFNSLNEFILDAMRHQIGAGNGIKKRKVHQPGAEPQVKVTVDDKPAEVRKPADKGPKLCKHGYLPKMCKFEACRRK